MGEREKKGVRNKQIEEKEQQQREKKNEKEKEIEEREGASIQREKRDTSQNCVRSCQFMLNFNPKQTHVGVTNARKSSISSKCTIREYYK